MREAELTLYLPQSDPQVNIEAASKWCRLMPGVISWIPDPLWASYGSVLCSLHDEHRMRPDAGTVVAVGGPKRKQSSQWDPAPPFNPGDRILTRPYKNVAMADIAPDIPELWMTPKGWHWEHCILAVEVDGVWMPLNDWLIIKRETNEEQSGLLIARPGSKPKKNLATVISSAPGFSIQPGMKVLVDPHPNCGSGFKFGELEGCEFVKCVTEDKIRKVWAVVEEAVATDHAIVFDSEESAKNVAERMWPRNPKSQIARLEPHFCPECNAWHLRPSRVSQTLPGGKTNND